MYVLKLVFVLTICVAQFINCDEIQDEERTGSVGPLSISCLIGGSKTCSYKCSALRKIFTGHCVRTSWARWKTCQCIERDEKDKDFYFLLTKIKNGLYESLNGYDDAIEWVRNIFEVNKDGNNRIKLNSISLYKLLQIFHRYLTLDSDFYKKFFGCFYWGKTGKPSDLKSGLEKNVRDYIQKYSSTNPKNNLELLDSIIKSISGENEISYNPTYLQAMFELLLPQESSNELDENQNTELEPKRNMKLVEVATGKRQLMEIKPIIGRKKSLVNLGHSPNQLRDKWLKLLETQKGPNAQKNIILLIKQIFAEDFNIPKEFMRELPLNRDNIQKIINILLMRPDFKLPDGQLDMITNRLKKNLKLISMIPLDEKGINGLLKVISKDKIDKYDYSEKTIKAITDALQTEDKDSSPSESLKISDSESSTHNGADLGKEHRPRFSLRVLPQQRVNQVPEISDRKRSINLIERPRERSMSLKEIVPEESTNPKKTILRKKLVLLPKENLSDESNKKSKEDINITDQNNELDSALESNAQLKDIERAEPTRSKSPVSDETQNKHLRPSDTNIDNISQSESTFSEAPVPDETQNKHPHPSDANIEHISKSKLPDPKAPILEENDDKNIHKDIMEQNNNDDDTSFMAYIIIRNGDDDYDEENEDAEVHEN